jgi:hypothetical protein
MNTCLTHPAHGNCPCWEFKSLIPEESVMKITVCLIPVVLTEKTHITKNSDNLLHKTESFWQGGSRSVGQISHLLQNPKVLYHVHESLPLVLAISQMTPIHSLPPYFFKTHFNIFFSHLCLGLPGNLFYSDFLTKLKYIFIITPMHAAYPSHLILIDLSPYLVKSANYEASHFALFLLLPPSWVWIFSSAPCS